MSRSLWSAKRNLIPHVGCVSCVFFKNSLLWAGKKAPRRPLGHLLALTGVLTRSRAFLRGTLSLFFPREPLLDVRRDVLPFNIAAEIN